MVGVIAAIAVQASKQASREIAQRLNADLQNTLGAHGWPEHLTRHVRMGSTGAIHIHPAGRDAVMDLEYGTEDTPPSGALRRFQSRMNILADLYATHTLHTVYAEVM